MEKNDKIEDRYLHGLCYPMAIALHRETGWPIHVLTAKRDSPNEVLPHPAHAWVGAPDGSAFDVSGMRELDALKSEYLSGRDQFTLDSASVEEFATEDDFRRRLKVLFNSDLYWGEYEQMLGREVIEATEVVSSYVMPRYMRVEEELLLGL